MPTSAAPDGATAEPPHVVDFGSGSGNSALAFAALLPGVRFTLIDAKADAVRIGQARTVHIPPSPAPPPHTRHPHGADPL